MVGKLKGVESVAVNFASEKASVKYNPTTVRLSEIKQAIAKAGYKALEIQNETRVDEDKRRKEKKRGDALCKSAKCYRRLAETP